MAISGKEIFRTHDQYGPVQVFDDGNKRYLAFGSNDEQSCQLKTDPAHLQYEYTRAMLLVLLFNPSPGSALLLGLGGGSLACCLHQHLEDIELTAVELRRTVIEVAHSHFQLPRSPRLNVIEANADDFLRERECDNMLHSKPGNLYNLIFSDIYGAHGVDDLQLQERYLDQCLHCLSDDGWLVLNCWKEHRGEAALLAILKERFAEVRMCVTQSGNWIILAGKQSIQENDKQLRERAKQWATTLGFSLQAPLAKLKTIL